jgi:hypothetical protein
MTPAETAKLLAFAAAYDQRTIGETDVLAWHYIIGHRQLADALEAVKQYYAKHRERIMPADVNKLCREIGNERWTDPSVNETLEQGRLKALDPARHIPGRRPNHEIPQWLTHPCPHCQAKPGRPCHVTLRRRELPLRYSACHPSRADLAGDAQSRPTGPDRGHT